MDAAFDLFAVSAVAVAVGLSGALSPGPLTVLAIREAATHGVRAGPLATLGHAAAEAAVVLALALGLDATLDEGGPLAAAIALAGGAILVLLGASMLRRLPRAELATGAAARGGARAASAGRVVLLGLLVSVGNPYWAIWWASVGAKLTADSLEAGAAGPAAFYAGHVLSDLLWLTLLAWLVHSGRRWFGRRAYRGLLAVCAAFLLVLGAYFLASGVAFLR